MKFEITLTASSYNTYESSMEIEAKDENEARKKIEEMDDEGKLEEKLQEDNDVYDLEDIDWDIKEMKD
tara:strand:- start:570 stop:773 length:204 start_codon:yes stop_codon:yes gene_type:complete